MWCKFGHAPPRKFGFLETLVVHRASDLPVPGDPSPHENSNTLFPSAYTSAMHTFPLHAAYHTRNPLRPTPYVSHPTPYALSPTHYTLHPTL